MKHGSHRKAVGSGQKAPEQAKDVAGVPDGVHEDEPKGTPNSDRYHTEIASTKK